MKEKIKTLVVKSTSEAWNKAITPQTCGKTTPAIQVLAVDQIRRGEAPAKRKLEFFKTIKDRETTLRITWYHQTTWVCHRILNQSTMINRANKAVAWE